MSVTMRASCRRTCLGCTTCVLPLSLLKLIGQGVPFISALDMTIDQLVKVERALRNHFPDVLRFDCAATQAAVRAASALPSLLACPSLALRAHMGVCCAHRTVHSGSRDGSTPGSRG